MRLDYNQLVAGQMYSRVRNDVPDGQVVTARFLGIDNATGYPRFAAGAGGATNLVNPRIHNFYAVGDADIPNDREHVVVGRVDGAAQVPGAPVPMNIDNAYVVPVPGGGKPMRRRHRTSRKARKGGKSRRQRTNRR